MDKQTVVDLVSDRIFQDAIRSLVDKTPVETVSFIAISIATVIAALSLIVAIIQLRRQMVEWNNSSGAVAKQLSLLKTSVDEDHRRSRREFAIDLIRSWETSQQHESTSVMFFVEELKYDQCICLYEQKPLKVGEPALSKLLACLQHSFANAKEDNLLTEDGHVVPVFAAHIRFTIISYLNSLETVMCAWKHSVADRAIITEEFKFLWDQKERKATLETFRKAVRDSSQVEVFPGIFEFVNDLRHNPPADDTQAPTGPSTIAR